MTSSLRKLLLISITLLLGVMSGGVHAQFTDYTFSYAGTYDGYTNISGNFTANDSNGGNVSSGSFYENGILVGGTSFSGSYNTSENSQFLVSGLSKATGGDGTILFFGPNKASGMGFNMVDNVINYGGVTATITSVGAPEIDGSLAPKVGFLLGCLFLMFGRKKQNSEPRLVSSAI